MDAFSVYIVIMKYLLILCLSSLSVTNSTFSQQKSGEKTKTTLAATQRNDNVFVYVEQMPEPSVNVNEYIARQIVLPEDAMQNSLDGKVVLRFIVNEKGDLDSIRIIKSLLPSIDSTVLRIVDNMPPWRPGIQNGNPVRVYYSQAVPIRTIAKVSDTDSKPEPLFDLHAFLNNNIIYPNRQPDSVVEGSVVVQFIVNTDSTISGISIKQPFHPLLDNEVLRVVKMMPKWKPAYQNGKFIESSYSLSIALRWGTEADAPIIDSDPKPTFDLGEYLYLEAPYSMPGVKRDRYNRVVVPVTFIINEDGSVSDVQVVKSVHRTLDEDTIKKISSMPKWKPALSGGIPVRMRYSVNVTYAGRIR